MRVLVCGGRRYGRLMDDTPAEALLSERERAGREYSLLRATLNELLVDGVLTEIIQGGASGADSIAATWAARNMVKCETFMANWKVDGKAAGPLRNQRMLDEGKPDLVLAFPGGRGTADMIKRAREAGLPVKEIDA